jgi:hypothetical protein
MSRISWGIDGYGRRHYDCAYCGLYFGMINPELIKHECDLSKPRYHNSGVICPDAERERKYQRLIKANKSGDSFEIQEHISVEEFNKNAKVFDDLND